MNRWLVNIPLLKINSRIKMMIKLANSDLPYLERPDITGEQLEQINAVIARCTARVEDQRYLTASSVAYHFRTNRRKPTRNPLMFRGLYTIHIEHMLIIKA